MTLFDTMKAALVGLALTASAFDAPTATAAVVTGTADAPSITVDFSDLDINSPVGARHLYVRIETAAASVCGAPVDARQLSRHTKFKKCFDGSVERAVEDINATALTAVYHKKTGAVG